MLGNFSITYLWTVIFMMRTSSKTEGRNDLWTTTTCQQRPLILGPGGFFVYRFDCTWNGYFNDVLCFWREKIFTWGPSWMSEYAPNYLFGEKPIMASRRSFSMLRSYNDINQSRIHCWGRFNKPQPH